MRASVILGVIMICASPARGADEVAVTQAKDLYLSAAYDDALAALTRITDSDPAVVRVVEQYRALCLYALGRRSEAEDVAESLIERNPLMTLEEASPRVNAMFQDVRRRVLPRLIRVEYSAAREAMDQKSLPRAEVHLSAARDMIKAAREIGAADERLNDLAVLVDGFISLNEASAANAAPPPSPAAREPAAWPAPRLDSQSASTTDAETIYENDDPAVIPPAIVVQRIPPLPNELARFVTKRPARGVLELVIDESGLVHEATIRQSLHPLYDALVVERSLGWQYSPATKNGVPVKFRRTIMITLK